MISILNIKKNILICNYNRGGASSSLRLYILTNITHIFRNGFIQQQIWPKFQGESMQYVKTNKTFDNLLKTKNQVGVYWSFNEGCFKIDTYKDNAWDDITENNKIDADEFKKSIYNTIYTKCNRLFIQSKNTTDEQMTNFKKNTFIPALNILTNQNTNTDIIYEDENKKLIEDMTDDKYALGAEYCILVLVLRIPKSKQIPENMIKHATIVVKI